MASLNICQFIGRVGKTPDIRTSASGITVANFSIACDEKYKDKSGQLVEKTEWINIVFFGKVASIVESYVDKGKEIYVSGRMTTEKYTDKEGVEKYAVKIIGDKLVLLGSKGDGQRQQGGGQQYEEPSDFDSDSIPF